MDLKKNTFWGSRTLRHCDMDHITAVDSWGYHLLRPRLLHLRLRPCWGSSRRSSWWYWDNGGCNACSKCPGCPGAKGIRNRSQGRCASCGEDNFCGKGNPPDPTPADPKAKSAGAKAKALPKWLEINHIVAAFFPAGIGQIQMMNHKLYQKIFYIAHCFIRLNPSSSKDLAWPLWLRASRDDAACFAVAFSWPLSVCFWVINHETILL